MERMVFIGVGQVAIVLVYRILDALQPQPVELGIFFIGNEPTIRRKGVSIGGVYHLDHNKTLILADGHLNEPALRVGGSSCRRPKRFPLGFPELRTDQWGNL